MRKKKWVKPFLEDEKVYLIDSVDTIKTNKPIYLEIGMGMGDFIVESAKNNPDVFYIGLEKDETCVARAIKKAIENKVDNLRIMLINAEMIDEIFKEKSLDRIYLHFSDPWPKKRNHKRRLTYPSFLAKYKKVLKKDGDLIFKTDNKDLFIDSLDYFKEANIEILEINYDYHSIKRNEPMTAYEAKFVSLGQPIYYVNMKFSD